MADDDLDEISIFRQAPSGKEAADICAYIESMCVELGALAEQANLRGLARILGVAVTEAYMVGERHRAESAGNEPLSLQP